MRNLLKTLAVMLLMTAAIMWLVTASKRSASGDVMVPPAGAQAVTLHRPRPEVRIEQLLNLEEPNGFDPDLQNLLRKERARQEQTDANPGFEQTASMHQGGGSQ